MIRNGSIAHSYLGGAAALVVLILGGLPLYVSLFALFLKPVSHDLGWDLATFPQGLLAFSISYALAAPFAGRMADRLGTRPAVLAGIALTTAGLVGISFMTGARLPLLICSFTLGVGGALVAPTTLAARVASYFERGRGLAMGIIFGAGPMLAAAAFSPLTSSAIDHFGWRVCYRGLAAVSAILSLAAVGFLGPLPARLTGPNVAPGLEAPGKTLREAAGGRDFWLIVGVSIVLPIMFGGISGHLVVLASEKGLSPAFGAAMLSAVFLGGVTGPVAAGAVADWLGKPQALLPFVAAPLIGFILLIVKVEGLVLLLSSALIGLGFGAWSGQTALLITRYFGLRSTGAIVGPVFAIGGIFLGLGPVVLGLLRTAYGTYQPALLLCIGLQAAACILIALLGPFAQRPPKAAGEDMVGVAAGPAKPLDAFR